MRAVQFRLLHIGLLGGIAASTLAVPAEGQGQTQEIPASTGALPNRPATITPVTPADLLAQDGREWLTYHGDYSGRHFSPLEQIDLDNVAQLDRAWVSETNPPFSRGGFAGPPELANRALAEPGPGRTTSNVGVRGPGEVRSAPLYRDGTLFYTIGQNAYAVDARTGRQQWHSIAQNTGGISNRGLGLSGTTLFMMANGGLTALDAATGTEKWRVDTGATIVPYAPMVVGNRVYISGGSGQGRTRAWLEARDVDTGAQEWIWYATPFPGDEAADTWPSVESMAEGGGSPWQPLTYDPATNLVYFGTGNADPMKDGRSRLGDNLYTSTIMALDAASGRMAWHFQATPHDDHDYDATQVTVLFEAQVDGRQRQLLGLAGRNGYFILLDRVTGENLLTRKIFEEVNWSRYNRPNGSPEPQLEKSPQPGGALVFPSSEGVTNWPAPSFSPQSGLFYFNAVRSYSMFYPDGDEYFIGSYRNSLRALDPVSGDTVWSHDYPEPYGIHARYPGVLTTAGGLLFTGDMSGNVVAFDAASGAILWHDELPLNAVSNAPITFELDGRQYVVVGSGQQLVAYALPREGE